MAYSYDELLEMAKKGIKKQLIISVEREVAIKRMKKHRELMNNLKNKPSH